MREHPAMRDHPGVDVYAGQAARRHDSNVMFTLRAGNGPAAKAIAKRTGRRGVAGPLEPRSVDRDPPSRLCRIRPPRASQSARRELRQTASPMRGRQARTRRPKGEQDEQAWMSVSADGTSEPPSTHHRDASARPHAGRRTAIGFRQEAGSRKRTRPLPCPQGPDSESPDMAHGAASRSQSARPTLLACKPCGPRSTSNCTFAPRQAYGTRRQ